MITVFDTETTFQVYDDRNDPKPFNPNNYLVSIGWKNEQGFPYYCVRHNEQPADFVREHLVETLKNTTTLVAHNIKFDLMWLYELGYEYTGEIYDTMLVEYVLSRGRKRDLDLTSCCARYGIAGKDDGTKEYIQKGISFEAIPWSVVEPYGRQDILICEQLMLKQLETLGATIDEVQSRRTR